MPQEPRERSARATRLVPCRRQSRECGGWRRRGLTWWRRVHDDVDTRTPIRRPGAVGPLADANVDRRVAGATQKVFQNVSAHRSVGSTAEFVVPLVSRGGLWVGVIHVSLLLAGTVMKH